MTTSEKATSKWNWKKSVFVISLAINFLIAGMVGGAMFIGSKKGDVHNNRQVMGGLRPFISELTKEERKDLIGTYRKKRESFKGERDTKQSQLTDVVSKIKMQPFDVLQLEAAFADLRNSPKPSAVAGHKMLIETIANMSDDERASYAERVEIRLKNPRPKRDK